MFLIRFFDPFLCACYRNLSIGEATIEVHTVDGFQVSCEFFMLDKGGTSGQLLQNLKLFFCLFVFLGKREGCHNFELCSSADLSWFYRVKLQFALSLS